MNTSIAVFALLSFLLHALGSDEDYYKLLEVEKSADLRDIRKAFKRLAVIMHPDKSPDDKDAHKNFLKIAEAYETLKDPTKRREYDMYGKRGNQGSQPRYHSYTYYRDQFGIYDDDPLIVTLSGDDYDSSVADGVWFVNFYSPQCSHCHHLAPEWRKLSELLEGVVRIAAVNCEDDFNLCWRLNLRAYPTLLFYGEKATSLQGQEYHGDRKSRPMERFVMEHLAKSTIPTIKAGVDEKLSPWALLNCAAGDCLEENTQLKLVSLLRGLVSVGIIKDKKVLKKFTTKEDATVIFYTNDNNKVELFRSDYKELADDILGLLPEAQQVLVDDFQEIRNKLRESDEEDPWLLCFSIGQDTEHQVIMKQLPALLKNFHIGQINCGRSSGLCQSLHISKYPTWGILKSGGAFEVFHGRESLHAIKKFAHETQEAKNLQALSPQDLKRIMQEGSPWIIGWLLSGCPPCKKMLPALRKASIHFSPSEIQFGTVDCAVHSHVCRQYNVNAYPHVSLYNQSREATYQDSANENNIVEFIHQMKHNYVRELTLDNFNSEIGSKSESEVWVVEFYAPWCGPCQRLQPEWRKLAKKLSHLDNVNVGSVDCVAQSSLCSQQGIRSYPTIWMYPPGSKGLSSIAFYAKGQPRELNNLLKWVFSFMQNSLTMLTSEDFRDVIENSKQTKTWIVMFFAPWCGYCHEFEPEFITASQILKDKVNAAKVDCQSNGALCQKQNINAYPSVKLYQRTNGVTRTTAGIPLHAREAGQLVQEIRSILADAFVTQLNHDEL